jgi:YidC/Oxa1 family membrane protein insertase
MNKNTILAFVLILATLAVFTSPTYQKFYYSTILKQPYPEGIAKNQNSGDSTGSAEKETAQQNTEVKKAEENKTTETITIQNDTNKTLKGDTIWIETETFIAGISEIGARIISLQMKEYRIDHVQKAKGDSVSKGNRYVELITEKSLGGAGMTINNTSYDGIRFSLENAADGKTVWVKKGDRKTLSFITRDAQGNAVQKQYLFNGEGYSIGLKVKNNLLNNSRLTISWPSGIVESEIKSGLYQTEERKAHYFDGQNVQHIQSNKPYKEEASGFFRWVGISSKYFFVAIIADTNRDADLKIIAFEEDKMENKDGKKNKTKRINYSINYQLTEQGNEAKFCFYTGPSKVEELKKADLKFEKILFPILGWTKIFFWSDKWFPWIAEFVLWLLTVLFGFTKDYGVSILLLTILSRVVTYPLTQSSMKSMNRMKDLQPKINVLRQKHKSNPTKMNQEIMALYKKEGVNPLNPGCLPMFLQMPIFIALFVVLRKAIELRGAGTVLLPWVHDLSLPESVFSFDNLIPGGIPLYGSNFAVLPVVMAILTYFQNKMTIKDPNQKMMIYFMPVFMLVLFNNFPSGLVFYWTCSSALGLLQQYYTDKKRKKNSVFRKTGQPLTAKN